MRLVFIKVRTGGRNPISAHLAHGDQLPDCAGICGGSAVRDCSGACGGAAEYDCAGVCGGSDTCGSCNITCTCTAIGGCGNCGLVGVPPLHFTNLYPQDAENICLFADGPCNNDPDAGGDGSQVFVHGWTCE